MCSTTQIDRIRPNYGSAMARRGITGPPNSYLVSGVWPDGEVVGPTPARYAAEVGRRLQAAVGGRPLREIAELADLDHTTLWAVLRGDRWPDLVTLAKLEEALDLRLWPD